MDQFTRITKLLENKTVCLVGNSVEMLDHDNAEYIDGHDIVIRLGRGIPHKHTEHIGKKMDIWATGFLRHNTWKKFPESWKNTPVLLNRTRMNLNSARSLDIELPHCTMFSDDELLEVYEEFGYVNNELLGRPSNGFIVLLWLIRKAWVWNKLTLIGFDFFSKQAPFQVGQQNPYSWHLPKNTTDTIPHNVAIEKEFVLELANEGIIHWEILSDLEDEVLEF